MSRVLVADPIDESGLEILRQAGADVVLLEDEDRSRLPELLPEFDALVVRSGTRVDAGLLRAGRRLKVVGRAGIGVDNVDVATATELGILVVNAPTANLVSATEHTFALLLSLARNVPSADRSVRDGEWDRKRFRGMELHGKTLGVVGFGRIGQGVALRAHSFGMKVLAFDPYLDPAVARRQEVELLPLEELLPQCDVVTLHTPLTDQTRNLIGARSIETMRPGALLINCGRGGVIDEEALLSALESGHLGGVALDVFATEPPADRRLARHPRVVSTPHIGAQTHEAQVRVATETALMVLAALDGSLEITAVNLPFTSTGAKGKKYLNVGEQLGRLASSLLGGSLHELELSLWGIEEKVSLPVKVAAIKGALTPFLGEAVNFVNAERIAQERGIQVSLTLDQESEEYSHLVEIALGGENGRIVVAGTVFGEREPRVVRFDGYQLEFRPSGRLLFLRNLDVPGVVGRVGGILGEAGTNIAEIHLSRRTGGTDAVAVLRLDQEPSRELLDNLEALPEIQSVQFIDLGVH